MNGRRKLMMDFSQPAALKAKKAAKASAGTATGTTGQARVVPLAQLKQSKQPVSNPLSRKRSRQQIIEEEQAFDDSAWPSDDDYSPGEEPAVSGATVAGTSTKKRKSTGNDGPPDLEQQCFSELQALKSKVGLPPHARLSIASSYSLPVFVCSQLTRPSTASRFPTNSSRCLQRLCLPVS